MKKIYSLPARPPAGESRDGPFQSFAARLEDDEKDVHLVDTLGGKGGHNPPMEVLVRLTNNQITSYLDNLQRRKA